MRWRGSLTLATCCGRYTEAELREIDDFAFALGVEIVPCIQTLAHLSTALRWPCYSGMVDCRDILMAGEDSTYALVEKMIAHMALLSAEPPHQHRDG